MARFVLEWDDFGGGYWVGKSDIAQPANTWRGRNCWTDSLDGYLSPLPNLTTLAYTATVPTPGDTSAPAFLFMATGGTAYRVYLTTTANQINCCRYVPTAGTPSAGTLTVTNTALTTTGNWLWSATAWNDTFLFTSYTPSAGVNTLARINLSTLAVTNYTGPAAETSGIRCLTRWGEFMFGAGFLTPYRLYYSNAYDPTTWGATNYYDIGDASAITAIVPSGDTLYVCKPEGWYAITGVPGTSLTIRRIAPGIPGVSFGYSGGSTFGPTNGFGAVESPMGVLFSTVDQQAVALNGNVLVPLNYQPPVGVIQTIMPGLYGCGGGTNGSGGVTNSLVSASKTPLWVLDTLPNPNRWFRMEVPYSAGSPVAQMNFSQLLPANKQKRWVYVDSGVALSFIDLSAGGGMSAQTATAALAERRHKDPFTVRDLYVEVAYTADGVVTPSVDARIEVRGWADLPVPGRIPTSTVPATGTATASTPATGLYFDRNYALATFRFSGDAVAGTGIVPWLQFSGCKVRRVWAVCDSSGGES